MLLGGDEEKFKLKYLWQCLSDWKTFASRKSFFPTLVGHVMTLCTVGMFMGV